MTMFLSIALSLLTQSPEMVEIKVTGGRDPTTLADLDNVFRGTCDGREASAVIEKPIRGRAGRLVLRVGRFAQQVPARFLDGRLFGNSFYAAGLACDGQTVIFRARVVWMDAEGRVNIRAQSAMMDMVTGHLSVSEARTLDQDEVRLELR